MKKKLVVFFSLAFVTSLLLAFTNCSDSPMGAAAGGQDSAGGPGNEDLASKSCTTDQLNDLEQRMRSSLQSVSRQRR